MDSADQEQIGLAAKELHRLFSMDEVKNEIPLLILANKQDLPGAMTAEEVAEKLGMDEDRNAWACWHIEPLSAVTGEGLYEGIEWMYQRIKTVK